MGDCHYLDGNVKAEKMFNMTRELAEILGIDPARLRLLSMVAAHDPAEACVCDLTEPLGLSQPTVSHHLKVLVDAGLATSERRGRNIWYGVVPAALEALRGALAAR